MTTLKHTTAVFFVFALLLTAAFAQEEKSASASADSASYLFPPRPKNNMSFGVKFGFAAISGDIRPQPGWTFGVTARKALGHTFSFRFDGNYGWMTGLNFSGAQGYYKKNPAWQTYTNAVATPNAAIPVFYNFRTTFFDLNLQGLVSFNNINFYKRLPNWNVYGGAGLGLAGYHARVDALNASNAAYNFTALAADPTVVAAVTSTNGFGSARAEAIATIKEDLDYANFDYETAAQEDLTAPSLELGDNRYTLRPLVTALGGFRYKIGRRLDVELEHRISWINDDLVDGQQWTEHGGIGETSPSRDMDNYSLTTLGIQFRVGKGEDAMWWTNPVTETFTKVQEVGVVARKLTADADGDKIPDMYDVDPNTPAGVSVGADGRALDSDRDGVPDSEDKQLFTPNGASVDKGGLALDDDGDGVPNIYDKENKRPGAGDYVDSRGFVFKPGGSSLTEERVIELIKQNTKVEPGTATAVTSVGGCALPMINFDLDKDNIKPEFYPELYYVAQVMKQNPAIKVRATGHTDVRNTDAYNQDLSMRRVNNTVNFIVNTYGIDKARFITDYKGESKTLVSNLPANRSNPKLEPMHSLNRRVEFECVK